MIKFVRCIKLSSVKIAEKSFLGLGNKFAAQSLIKKDILNIYLCTSLILSFKGLIPSLTLQQHRISLQRQKREQNLKEQREHERNSPAKKKSSAASALLCAKKSNKRKRLNSPFKRG